jgi:phenylpropionate dioxygenase-like ring-hydroxylating dioxygenase large terminal subunit
MSIQNNQVPPMNKHIRPLPDSIALEKSQVRSAPENWDRSGLPAWAYTSGELLELEKEQLFRRHWQIAGHVNDAPEPGHYFCFDVAGERALIVRDKQGEIRAFHNVCRHRGSRVAVDDKGKCGSALVCPFHGWSFNLDGTLRSVPQPRSFPELDPEEHGLVPLEFEIWHGFVFVRFKPGPQPSVKELLARHEPEVALYNAASAVSHGEVSWSQTIKANWKCVRDVDNEGYHVPIAHPALQDLYGSTYFDEGWQDGTNRSFGVFNARKGRLWSTRHYLSILPEIPHLPESHRRAWLYIGIFPNQVMFFYPEGLGYYQEYPKGVVETVIRGGYYCQPIDDSEDSDYARRLRAARYLAGRIDGDTGDEDVQLTIWSNEAMHSSGFKDFVLSDLEYGVKGHHDQLRKVMPVLSLPEAPASGMAEATNAAMLAARQEDGA